MNESIIFEKKYGVKLSDFSTIEEIEHFIEEREGKKLELVTLDSHGIASSGYRVFKFRKYDIDRMYDKAIKPNWLQHLRKHVNGGKK